MTIKCSSLFLLAIILLTLNSCATYYVPNTHQVPMFTDKGQTQIVGVANWSTGFSDEIVGGDLQVAHSVSDNLAVMGNFAYFSDNSPNIIREIVNGEVVNTWDGDRIYGDIIYGEGAVGYFKTFGKKQKGVFENYGGVGFGYVNNHYIYDVQVGNVKGNYLKAFTQPSIGFTSSHFDIAFVQRMGFLYYMNVTDRNLEARDLRDPFELRQNKTSILWEPGVIVRSGWEKVKFQFNFGVSTNLNNNNLGVLGSPAHFGLGVVVNLGKSKERKH